MHLFSTYIQPLTAWLHTHPHLALFITFFISMCESLAIIGTLIPGSFSMTAIGILAGSGVMRIDLTYIAAIVGAIAGDGFSYFLGRYFSEQLPQIWPFRRYPQWVTYGRNYFDQHGGKSVIIGRFFGPLRSMIPVVAGMLHMNQIYFFLANVFSAVLWAFIYVSPGVLIGAVGSELSTDNATHFFLMILLLLGGIWIMSLLVKWLITRFNAWFDLYCKNYYQQHACTWIKNVLKRFITSDSKEPATTILIIAGTVIGLLISFLLPLAAITPHWHTAINQPIGLFIHSFRTLLGDQIGLAITLIFCPLSCICCMISFSAYAIYQRQWRLFYYGLSLFAVSILVMFVFKATIDTPLLNDHRTYFPDPALTYGTVIISFVLLYFSYNPHTLLNRLARVGAIIVLLIAGYATLAIGNNWFLNVIAAYFFGLTLTLCHWLGFRRQAPTQIPSVMILLLIGVTLFGGAIASYGLQHKALLNQHHNGYTEQVHELNAQQWWLSTESTLPLYTKNRLGQYLGVYNIQYAGSLQNFYRALTQKGWKKKPHSFFYSLLMRTGGKKSPAEYPLISPIYGNRKPLLTLSYHTPSNLWFIIRLWPSHFYFNSASEPLYIGSITPLSASSSHPQGANALISEVVSSFDCFDIKVMPLPRTNDHHLAYPIVPAIFKMKPRENEALDIR